MVEAEQRQHSRIGTLEAEWRPGAVTQEALLQNLCGTSPSPFVEIADYDSGTTQFRFGQNFVPDQHLDLLAAFHVARTEVHVEYIHFQVIADINHAVKHAALLTPRSCDVMCMRLQDGEARQHHVAVTAAMEGSRLSESHVEAGKRCRNLICLVELASASRRIDDLLQAEDIHVEFRDNANHAFRRNGAVDAATLMRVI